MKSSRGAVVDLSLRRPLFCLALIVFLPYVYCMTEKRGPGRPRKEGGPNPNRSLRLGPIYDTAKDHADQRGEKITHVVEQALEAYVNREDIVVTMDLCQTAATVIARARANSGLTAPEFDYRISVEGIGGPRGPLGNETYELANTHMPEVEPGQDNRLDERDANWIRLWEALQPEMEAYAQKCRDRKYTNWSTAAQSRGKRIQYAD
jgi:hypothetical protein